MKKPEVLVTGANGFIGQHLVNYLGEMGFGVTAMIRRGSWPIFNLDNGVRVVYGDLLDQRSLEEVMKSGMVVVNLAVNSYDPKESYKVNVGGLENLIMV